jgi:TatD DNase family protein
MELVDSHAHLDYIGREGHDLDAVMAQAAETGLSWLVNPSVTPDKFADVLAMTARFPNVFAAAAVHPTDVQDVPEATWLESVIRMLEHPKVVAIGETGLDYYWDKTHLDLQHHFFRTFLNLGRQHDLPVIVHDREAHEDVHRLISEFPGVRGVMHCFSGDPEFARRMIDCGFYISFAGNLTFKNATNLHDTARDIPLEHLLIETDSPFLSPVPFRGKPNEPARVRLVAEKIAELKGISVETVAAATAENARKVFAPCFS